MERCADPRAQPRCSSAYASREVATLPAGPLALALGAEARRESLADTWDDVVTSGSGVLSATPLSVSGGRTVYALFAELNVPVVRGLDAQLAVRYDDYSDFGSTTNPKVALRWQPVTSLLLRGSWGTGFRAPPLYDLYRPSSTSIDFGLIDPIRCPITGLPDDCDAFVEIIDGGNPELQPETSTQWNFGVVWEPARGLSLGVDYWNIEQDNVDRCPIVAERAALSTTDTPIASSAARWTRRTPGLPGLISPVSTTGC